MRLENRLWLNPFGQDLASDEWGKAIKNEGSHKDQCWEVLLRGI